MQSFIVGIINNLKLTINNIHIRFEDDTTNSRLENPFSFGFVLKGLCAISTDSKYEPADTDTDEATFFKVYFFIFYLSKISLADTTYTTLCTTIQELFSKFAYVLAAWLYVY